MNKQEEIPKSPALNELPELLEDLKKARLEMDKAFQSHGKELTLLGWGCSPEYTAHEKACWRISDYVSLAKTHPNL